MWDEKQFFEDYKKDSEQIQPDPDFTEKLKALAQEEPKTVPFSKARVLAAVASVAVCVGVGAVAWNGFYGPKESQIENSYLAGKTQKARDAKDTVEEETQETVEMQEEKSAQETAQDSMEPLEEALEAMRRGADVKDAKGEMLSAKEQQKLFTMLKSAERCEGDQAEESPTEIYEIEGEKEITIEKFKGGTFRIGSFFYREK